MFVASTTHCRRGGGTLDTLDVTNITLALKLTNYDGDRRASAATGTSNAPTTRNRGVRLLGISCSITHSFCGSCGPLFIRRCGTRGPGDGVLVGRSRNNSDGRTLSITGNLRTSITAVGRNSSVRLLRGGNLIRSS